MFNIKTEYETYRNCVFRIGEYTNNKHIYIDIIGDEGPVTGLTVNVPGIEKFDKNCSCVDTNNFPEGVALIKELGIGKMCGSIASGFCIYPVFKFDLEKIKNYTENKNG